MSINALWRLFLQVCKFQFALWLPFAVKGIVWPTLEAQHILLTELKLINRWRKYPKWERQRFVVLKSTDFNYFSLIARSNIFQHIMTDDSNHMQVKRCIMDEVVNSTANIEGTTDFHWYSSFFYAWEYRINVLLTVKKVVILLHHFVLVSSHPFSLKFALIWIR